MLLALVMWSRLLSGLQRGLSVVSVFCRLCGMPFFTKVMRRVWAGTMELGTTFSLRLVLQISLGGVVAIVGLLQGWGTEVLGALVLIVGIYMLQAAVLHLLDLKVAKQARYASKFANSAYAFCMIWFGIYAFSS